MSFTVFRIVRRLVPALALAGAVTPPAVAQCPAGGRQCPKPAGLLFSVLNDERSNQCPVAPNLAINYVRTNSLQYVEPHRRSPTQTPGLPPYSSKAYYPLMGYNHVLGDGDDDGQYIEPYMFEKPGVLELGGIDAILRPRDLNGGDIDLKKNRVFFSPAGAVPDTCDNTAHQNDVVRVQPTPSAGCFEYFLRDGHIKSAFGVDPMDRFNIDAICLAPAHPPGASTQFGYDIYLSPEEDVKIDVGFVMTVTDGSILKIPNEAITWGTSPHDGAALVLNVMHKSGEVVADEAMVQAWVTNSGLTDTSGALVTTVIDVDGLTLDPAGGTWQPTFEGGSAPHLWFSCEDSHGGGAVLSTSLDGAIAVLNGVPLGNNAPGPSTDGAQVGLVPGIGVSSLNGLALTEERTSHFSMDTRTALIPGPGTDITVEVGGAENDLVFIVGDWATSNPFEVDPVTFPLNANGDFCDFYPSLFYVAIVPIGVDHCGVLNIHVSKELFEVFAGHCAQFQAVEMRADGLHQTNPVKVQFYL